MITRINDLKNRLKVNESLDDDFNYMNMTIAKLKNRLISSLTNDGITIDLDVVNIPQQYKIKVFWAKNNKLHSYDIGGTIKYLQPEDIDQAINQIKSTI